MSRSRVLVCAVALLGAVALLVFLNARAHRGRSAGTAVEKLIGDLSSPDVATRASAARRLGEMGPRAASAVPALAALLGDQSEVGDGDLLGEKAGRALGKVGGPAADALLEAVSSKDPYVRNAAIQGLAFTTDSRATGPLHKALHDAVERVRWSAALSLGYRNDRTAASELVALLRSDRSATVRGAAATTLGVTKTKGSVDGLVAALRDRDASVRESAALGLGSIGDPRGVPPLIALLRDKMPGVRLAATGSLGAFTADPRVLEPLIGALRDEEIGDIGGGEAWGRSKIGSVAAGALAKSRDPRLVPRMVELLKDDNASVRWRAAWVLGMKHDRAAVGPLTAALRDKDGRVRGAAATALQEVRGQAPQDLPAERGLASDGRGH